MRYRVCRNRKVWKELPHAIHEELELPKVSVVVCSYNGGRTLRECLDSLMRVDFPDYEVILIDDGSTDETSQIAAECKYSPKGWSAVKLG